jgi:3-methylcrotonyl-CoA carboxylase alpha subunit
LFRRLLIVNRGEIAVRIARCCRESGITAVAVHSDADASALHVREADEAIPLLGSSPSETYLNIPLLLQAARRARCEAVHPGYGFLSENADFAEAVRKEGLIFVGPEAETIRRLGDKTTARALAQQAGVPVVPGYDGAGSDQEFAKQAKRLGFPVLVKAAGGGGGRGMRIVTSPSELKEALESARREAQGAFGNARVFLEKYIASARHVEIQILGDRGGKVISLFERDCSIQRRHQKILEESPSPGLAGAIRERMAATAVAAAQAAGYVNAGTVEFLLDPATLEFYFLEMNTRLQVEHPVTELRTGIDLVGAQFLLAAGGAISPEWAQASARGHAMECRVYAEDPAHGFAPSPGRILRWESPENPGVRVDAGYEEGDEVPVHYDALLAKIVVLAQDRESAARRMEQALEGTVILGPTTNLSLLKRIVAHPQFRSGRAATDFLSRPLDEPAKESDLPDEVLLAAAMAASESARASGAALRASPGSGESTDPWNVADRFRTGE